MPQVDGTLTADGASPEFNPSGAYSIHLSGTFGAGTAEIQFQDTAGSWKSYGSEYVYTSGPVNIVMNEITKKKIRINLSGATAPNLYFMVGYNNYA